MAALYAFYPPFIYRKEPFWRDNKLLATETLPRDVRYWLLDEGSLTQRLVDASDGKFRVEVLRQHWLRPHLSEALLLESGVREQALVREVLLFCHDQPWVFARSVIPRATLQGPLRYLRNFSNRPLGAMLFQEPSMRRRCFEVVAMSGDSDYLPKCVHSETKLWGRRSRFDVFGKPILVSEIFLPDFIPWEKPL